MPTQVQRVQQRAQKVKDDYSAVSAAAQKWHVPAAILWGVYGVETDFGQNVKTSSAGAKGPFQFLPSTGARYGLNANNINDMHSSADAAAHYLHDLFASTHSWDAALHAYSGGGYGLSEVQKKAHSDATIKLPSQGRVQDIVPKVVNPIEKLVAPLGDIANFFGGLGDLILHPRRLLKLIIGSILLLWGINQLSQAMVGVNPARGAKHLAQKASMAAAAAPK